MTLTLDFGGQAHMLFPMVDYVGVYVKDFIQPKVCIVYIEVTLYSATLIIIGNNALHCVIK